jgi:hypothetical protein
MRDVPLTVGHSPDHPVAKAVYDATVEAAQQAAQAGKRFPSGRSVQDLVRQRLQPHSRGRVQDVWTENQGRELVVSIPLDPAKEDVTLMDMEIHGLREMSLSTARIDGDLWPVEISVVRAGRLGNCTATATQCPELARVIGMDPFKNLPEEERKQAYARAAAWEKDVQERAAKAVADAHAAAAKAVEEAKAAPASQAMTRMTNNLMKGYSERFRKFLEAQGAKPTPDQLQAMTAALAGMDDIEMAPPAPTEADGRLPLSCGMEAAQAEPRAEPAIAVVMRAMEFAHETRAPKRRAEEAAPGDGGETLKCGSTDTFAADGSAREPSSNARMEEFFKQLPTLFGNRP